MLLRAAYMPDPRIGTVEALDRTRRMHARVISWISLGTIRLSIIHGRAAGRTSMSRVHRKISRRIRRCSIRLIRSKGTRFLARAKDPVFSPWKGRRAVKSFQAKHRATQIADLRNIAKHCDGPHFRDMAMLQLNDIFEKAGAASFEWRSAARKEFWTERAPAREA